MRKFGVVGLCGWLAGIVWGAAVAAQVPANWAVAMSSFGTQTGIVFFDRTGGTSNTIGFASLPGTALDAIETGPLNQTFLAWDTFDVYTYQLSTGNVTSVTLTIPAPLNAACIGEAAEMYACLNNGQVFRFQDISGSSPSFFANIGTIGNAICWDGTTGGVVAGEFSGTGGSLTFLDRNGNATQTVGPIPLISGVDWNPWDGSVLVSQFGALSRVTRSGGVTTLVSGIPPVATLNCVEITEQPVEEYVGGEFGGNPTHLVAVTPGGVLTTLNQATAANYGPSDVELNCARNIWGTGAWTVGGTGRINVDFTPAAAGRGYVVGASITGHNPGFPLGAAGTAHLLPDGLTFVTVNNLAPGVFRNFRGLLDNNGRPVLQPTVLIPNSPTLRNLRVWFSVTVLDPAVPGGFFAVSNAWGTTIL